MKYLLIIACAAASLGLAPIASAGDLDCYTQDTYNGGTRETCYTDYPDYDRIITTCDGQGYCHTETH